MRSSAKRKRAGRPRASQRRPVLAARVPQDFYAQIQADAALHGRNASEELIWRARQGYELEATLHRELAMLRDAKKKSVEEQLRQLGYTKVHGFKPDGSSTHAWFEPGVDAIQWVFANVSPESRAVLQEMLNRAAAHAVEKVKKEGQS
jgi:hypothetical protein